MEIIELVFVVSVLAFLGAALSSGRGGMVECLSPEMEKMLDVLGYSSYHYMETGEPFTIDGKEHKFTFEPRKHNSCLECGGEKTSPRCSFCGRCTCTYHASNPDGTN